MRRNFFIKILILTVFLGGFVIESAHAARSRKSVERSSKNTSKNVTKNKKVRVIYPKKTDLDFEGLKLEGELRNPGEFYFQHRPEEKFDSLVKRRANFHREMLRDVVLTQ